MTTPTTPAHTCNRLLPEGASDGKACIACDIEICDRTLREDPLPGNRFLGYKALDRLAAKIAELEARCSVMSEGFALCLDELAKTRPDIVELTKRYSR